MSLNPTNYGDNPFVPGASAQAYNPDQLIAGDLKLVTAPITIASSAALTRGTVLGQITTGGKYIKSVKSASDGSQVPTAILADDTDASGGDVVGAPVYLMGEFNGNKLVIDASWTVTTVTTALRPSSIFVKSAVSAADPS